MCVFNGDPGLLLLAEISIQSTYLPYSPRDRLCVFTRKCAFKVLIIAIPSLSLFSKIYAPPKLFLFIYQSINQPSFLFPSLSFILPSSLSAFSSFLLFPFLPPPFSCFFSSLFTNENFKKEILSLDYMVVKIKKQ